MRTQAMLMDFSGIMKIMLAMLLTAGLVLSSALAASAADRGWRAHGATFKDSPWRGGNRVTVIKTPPHRYHHDPRVIRHLPRGYKSVVIGHKHYYTHGGRYYERRTTGYISIAPPYGAWFLSLPIGSAQLTIGGQTFFRHQDTFYRPGRSGYVVVAPPPCG